MSAPTVVRDLVVAHTRVLKLPGVARTFEGLARQARDAHWPHEDYLQEVLSAEQASRHESVIRQRLREARFPEVKTLDTFDFAAADGVNATQVHTHSRGRRLVRALARFTTIVASARTAGGTSVAPSARTDRSGRTCWIRSCGPR